MNLCNIIFHVDIGLSLLHPQIPLFWMMLHASCTKLQKPHSHIANDITQQYMLRLTLAITISPYYPSLHEQHRGFGTDPMGQNFWLSHFQISSWIKTCQSPMAHWRDIWLTHLIPDSDLTSSKCSFFIFWWNFNVFITHHKGSLQVFVLVTADTTKHFNWER